MTSQRVPIWCLNGLLEGKGIQMWDGVILWGRTKDNPRWEGNMPIRPIVHAQLSKKGETSNALGSSTKTMKPRVKFLEAITK